MSNASYILSDQSETLKNFAQRFTRESSFYNAHEELIVIRYALSEKLKSLENVQTLLKALTTNLIEGEDPTDPKEVILLLRQQAQISTEITQSVERVVKTLKAGAEIDILTSNKLDGVQLLYILERIPILLKNVIRGALVNFCISQNIPVVEEIIDSHTQNITSEMSSTLRECEILTPHESNEGLSQGFLEEQVIGMLESVPMDDGTPASSASADSSVVSSSKEPSPTDSALPSTGETNANDIRTDGATENY